MLHPSAAIRLSRTLFLPDKLRYSVNDMWTWQESNLRNYSNLTAKMDSPKITV